MFVDVLSSASESDSELSQHESELSDSDSSENEQQDQLEETAKYMRVISLCFVVLISNQMQDVDVLHYMFRE